MKWFYTLMLATNLWFIGQLPAQNYQLNVQHFSMEDGLSNQYINTCIQDEQGFIWIGTLNGLCRFNGYDFDVFTIADSDLRVNNVVNVHQDLSGLIWVTDFHSPILFNGSLLSNPIIDIINPQTLEIIPDSVFLQKIAAPFSFTDLIYFNQTQDKLLWFVTRDWALYNYNGKAFRQVTTLSEKLGQLLWQMNILQDEIWFRTEFNYTGNTLYGTNLVRQESTAQLPFTVLDTWKGRSDTLWVVHPPSTRKLSYKPAGADAFQQISIEISDIDDSKNVLMERDQAGRFWYLNNGWLHILSPSGKLIGKFGTETGLPEYPTSLMIDENGNAWVCANDGMYILTLKRMLFENYYTSKHIDARGIWVDETGNMYSAQGSHFYKNEKKLAAIPSSVGIFHEDDYLWIGGYYSQITRYNLQTQQVDMLTTPTVASENGKEFSTYTAYRSKRTGRLWIGSLKGLAYIDTTSLSIAFFETENKALQEADIYHFHENESGLWLSTTQGLFLLDENSGTILAHYGKDWKIPFVSYLHEDEDGIFWMATQGGGLWRWDRANDHWQQFTREDGLSHDVLYAVYEDDFGYLWLPSNYGLMQFDKATQSVVTYLPEDGIASIEFNSFSHFQAEDGRLYFGGLNGISAFHPRDFTQLTENDADLYISGFQKLNGKTGEFENHTAQVLQNGEIVLQPYETSFLLRFALLDYEALDNNRFAFKIEGLAEEWSHISENFIRIGRLPYGKYTLHIKGKSADGQWSINQLAIPITVITPIHLRGWFLTVCLLFLGAVVFLIFKYREYNDVRIQQRLRREVDRKTLKIQEQADRLQALDEFKSQLYINISHEIRTPLTLILNTLQHLMNRVEAPVDKAQIRNIEQNSQKLIGLVEEILTLSKIEKTQLQLQETAVAFRPFVFEIFSGFESYATSHGIDYQLNYEIDDNLYLLLDRSKFSKIVSNLLSNALKFTSYKGQVIVLVREAKGKIHLTVTDTGAGISEEDLPHIFDRYYQVPQHKSSIAGGTGIGLAVAKTYADCMNGNLTVKSQVGEGSTFSFVFDKKEAQPTTSAQQFPNNKDLLINSIPEESTQQTHENTILIVEDNPAMQQLVKDILQPHYNLLLAANGKAALEQLSIACQQSELPNQRPPVDLILTDLMMPHMDGFTLLKHLKSNEKWHTIPVIVLTARADQSDKLKALRIGVDDYIIKPFQREELQVRIKNLISNQKKRLDLYLTDTADEKLEEDQDADFQSLAEHKWLAKMEKKALQLLEEKPEYKVSDLAKALYVSNRQLQRKSKRLTGLSPAEYIREIRLQEARRLLEQKKYGTVSEVVYTVGFSSPSYFSKLFYKRFNKLPSDYTLNIPPL